MLNRPPENEDSMHIGLNCFEFMSRRNQKRRHAMLRFIRDRLERQLAAVNASLETLEKQMQRDEEIGSEKSS